MKILYWRSFNSFSKWLTFYPNSFIHVFTCIPNDPVWICLFSLPIDYWGLATLKQIGDHLGTFIKASEATMQRRYTSGARICVEMDVSGALHEGLWLEFKDEDYYQAIDYEQIPF